MTSRRKETTRHSRRAARRSDAQAVAAAVVVAEAPGTYVGWPRAAQDANQNQRVARWQRHLRSSRSKRARAAADSQAVRQPREAFRLSGFQGEDSACGKNRAVPPAAKQNLPTLPASFKSRSSSPTQPPGSRE